MENQHDQLTPDELEGQQSELLPAREAMTVIQPLPVDMSPPTDFLPPDPALGDPDVSS